MNPKPPIRDHPAITAETGLHSTLLAVSVNAVLAVTKVSVGFIGHSYALVADGIESASDVASSLVVWGGLRVSIRPPDRTHPYGHGKAESLAAVFVSLVLIATAFLIASQSIQEIMHPHRAPAAFTLWVLVGIILVKESLYRLMKRVGGALGSQALKSDAWHHRSDALTSLAAFIGISIALIGGPGYEEADDWAALAACGVILFNGIRLLRPSVDEVMDAAVPHSVEVEVRRIAAEVPGVAAVEKCRIRKSGLSLLMDIHVMVDGALTVHQGHLIAHAVQDALRASTLPILDVMVHIEPYDEAFFHPYPH